jgi:hypothetical protein
MIEPIPLHIELLINKAKKNLPEQSPEEKERLAFIIQAIQQEITRVNPL